MRYLTLKNIAKICKGTLYNYYPEEDREVSGVTLDSRQAGENDLFIATKGERVNGHDFIPRFLKRERRALFANGNRRMRPAFIF